MLAQFIEYDDAYIFCKLFTIKIINRTYRKH